MGTEVVIDMPNAATTRLGDAPQQRWTMVAHAYCRQPAFLYQFAAPRNFGVQALDDHLTMLAVDHVAQPEDGQGRRPQSMLLDQAASCLCAAHPNGNGHGLRLSSRG